MTYRIITINQENEFNIENSFSTYTRFIFLDGSRYPFYLLCIRRVVLGFLPKLIYADKVSACFVLNIVY